jgi:hypothetical protein
MAARRSLGRQFELLWAAYAVSTFGTYLAFDAFPLIAILVLHTGPAKVSVLAAAGLAAGAALAIPLGPWVEFRRKRPVMVAMDLTRFVGVFNPVFATYRLDQTDTHRVARTLSAWSVTSNATIAVLTALWGLLASITSLRTAIAIAGVLMLTTPFLLPRRDHASQRAGELVA